MERLTTDRSKLWFDSRAADAFPESVRNDRRGAEAAALGARWMGWVVTQIGADEVEADDDEDDDDDDASESAVEAAGGLPRIEPLQLLQPPRWGTWDADGILRIPAGQWVVPERDCVINTERAEGRDWLSVYSLCEDGTIVRTIAAPDGKRADQLNSLRDVHDAARFGLRELLAQVGAVGENGVYVDRAGARVFSCTVPPDMALPAVLEVHRARVASVSRNSPAVDLDDPDTLLAVHRRLSHVFYTVFDAIQRAAVLTYLGGMFAIPAVAMFAPWLLGYSLGYGTLIGLTAAITGNALWTFCVGGPWFGPFIPAALLALVTVWAEVPPVVPVDLVVGCTAAQALRTLLFLGITGLGHPWVARWVALPPPVPAKDMVWAYR